MNPHPPMLISEDITERKHLEAERQWAEVELERSLSLLRDTFESTTDGLLVADGQGYFFSKPVKPEVAEALVAQGFTELEFAAIPKLSPA